ncbi:DNA polymerase III subunit beta [Pirellula sp. SH-Sr6A]|uniref:DNA polymerase III subunit beta n=1 Tax=Pirellula sp. SH-Sr6A TaxID=1632865 RepID=UPI00078ECCD6|nr:DNA polymerase III subunit beta [Pirellula sp. SH-Sr6A]AMV35673.1 DNA polymerase III subunit beta [Pirellula sp. SH-Sr6A]
MRASTAEFKRVFGVVARVANNRHKEILTNVHLSAAGGKATLTASDGEVYLQAKVDVEGDLRTLLPVSKVHSVLNECKGDEIEFNIDDGKHVKVQCGRARFQFGASSPDEFPVTMPCPDAAVQVKAGALLFAIRATEFACDESSARYQLGGVAFDLGRGSLECVATDGHRLSAFELACEGNAQIGVYIVPARALRVLVSMLGLAGESDDVTLRFSETELRADMGDCAFSTHLIEGKFPNWRQVLPSVTDAKEVILDVEEMFSGIRQAAIAADKESRSVEFAFDAGKVSVSSKTESGESNVEVPIQYDYEPVAVNVNHVYLADFFKALPAKSQSTMYVKDGNVPVMLAFSSLYRYVVMPMARS